MIRNCGFNGMWLLIHQWSSLLHQPTEDAQLAEHYMSCRITASPSRWCDKLDRSSPKRRRLMWPWRSLAARSRLLKICWCLGWIWDSLDSLDSFNLVHSELNQTGPECHEVRLRAIYGLRHRRDSQTDHLSSQRPGENGDQGLKVGSFPVATGNWDEKSRFTP